MCFGADSGSAFSETSIPPKISSKDLEDSPGLAGALFLNTLENHEGIFALLDSSHYIKTYNDLRIFPQALAALW
ncbi:MAG: hypothetical protein AMXMBFR4_26350 [Candidatus Hydrogenedentota bacterium]